MKKALITGITGQDGSYLAELLLSKGYEVHGLTRKANNNNNNIRRIGSLSLEPHLYGKRLFLHCGDLLDAKRINSVIYAVKPNEIYNLGAQSRVCMSFDSPEYTGEITGLGTTRILKAIRKSGRKIMFYQASSSEMFGDSRPPQNENTPFRPQSPYAAAKAYAYWITVNYRKAYNLFACNGILFNHESPRRGEMYVTKKIAKAVANIAAGKRKTLYLGNTEVKRDWGYAPEYVELIWKILQQKGPDDYVIGTGEVHTLREFAAAAFNYVGLKYKKYIRVDKRYLRPAEVNITVADMSKAKKRLKWQPRVKFEDLIKIMIDAEMHSIGLRPIGEGDKVLRRKFPERWWKGD